MTPLIYPSYKYGKLDDNPPRRRRYSRVRVIACHAAELTWLLTTALARKMPGRPLSRAGTFPQHGGDGERAGFLTTGRHAPAPVKAGLPSMDRL
jgi:hypothetical protein